MADRMLAEVAAGRAWAGTLTTAGSGPAAVRCEPLAGPGSGALVTVQHVQPDPGRLAGAAARIGSTLDLTTTAHEVAAAVPGFAAAAAIFVPERKLATDEGAWRQRHAAVRRLAARPRPASPRP